MEPVGFAPAPRVFPLEGAAGAISMAEALSRLCTRRAPVLLDSAGGAPRAFSLLAIDPLDAKPPATLAALRTYVARYAPRPGDVRPPGPAGTFFGGFLGALAYDLGVEGEALALPGEPWGLPLVAGGLYCDFLVRDEARRCTWLVLGEEPGDARPLLAERRASILSALAEPAPPIVAPSPLAPLVRRVARAEHMERIEAVRAAIARGELYQANLAHPLERALHADPVDLYLRLRAAAPTPYAGFLRADDDAGRARFALLSASPELLLAYDPARADTPALARTRPIKGTARRAADAAEDRARASALLASAKDRAELAMIVDLERNDLGRIAVPGGVRVRDYPELESHPAVHHLVATVEAEPRPEMDALAVLAALFPGGSITGAPKLASMEAIARLEREGRGFAFGSLGLIDAAGAARFNLLIRTLVWRPLAPAAPGEAVDGDVRLRVGGGITWRSDPADEDEETLAKAAALVAALE